MTLLISLDARGILNRKVDRAAPMSIQKIPLATLQKVRQYLQPALKLDRSTQDDSLPESIAALGDVFSRGFEAQPQQGWSLSAIDLSDIFAKLPGLKLQAGYRLVSYLWQDDRGSRAQVWAVPIDRATTKELVQAIAQSSATLPPRPAAALPDWMLAVQGDRSLGSFLVASLLRREMQSGTSGDYGDWSHHHLIDRVPTALRTMPKAAQLQNLSPRLRQFPDRRVAVEFFTCRSIAPIGIFRHVDLYSATNYTANSLDRVIV